MFMLCAFTFGLTLMPKQTAKAYGETCYIILIPEGDVEDFYMSVR